MTVWLPSRRDGNSLLSCPVRLRPITVTENQSRSKNFRDLMSDRGKSAASSLSGLLILFLMLLGGVLFFIQPLPLYANNLALDNAEIYSIDTDARTIKVMFDLSWENSFRDNENHDAVWIFAKYTLDDGATWMHLTLGNHGLNPSGFSYGKKQSDSKISRLDIFVPRDRKGAFFYPRTSGAGKVNFAEVEMLWDFGADGVAESDFDLTDTKVRLFALEMVYIPEGSFYFGDGSTTNGAISYGDGSYSRPGVVNSEDRMMFTSSSKDSWYYRSDPGGSSDETSGATFDVPRTFPKGYSPFYVMKYELSEAEYVTFFNTLTSAQKTLHDLSSSHATYGGKNTDSTDYRNTFSYVSGNASSERGSRACTYLSWIDLCAFADWAALRPMSEIEFEKVARGPSYPVQNEYAWGTTTIVTGALTISGDEDGTETISSSVVDGAANYGDNTFSGGDGGKGALRQGIFATSISTRKTAGAGYYGVMELSGNVWEQTVTIGHPSGRAFSGSHGDGALSVGGFATNSDWPGFSYSDSGVSDIAGSGLRGGSWQSNAAECRISGRYFAGTNYLKRARAIGGRLVRSASV